MWKWARLLLIRVSHYEQVKAPADSIVHASGVQAKETGTEAAMEVDLDPSKSV